MRVLGILLGYMKDRYGIEVEKDGWIRMEEIRKIFRREELNIHEWVVEIENVGKVDGWRMTLPPQMTVEEIDDILYTVITEEEMRKAVDLAEQEKALTREKYKCVFCGKHTDGMLYLLAPHEILLFLRQNPDIYYKLQCIYKVVSPTLLWEKSVNITVVCPVCAEKFVFSKERSKEEEYKWREWRFKMFARNVYNLYERECEEKG